MNNSIVANPEWLLLIMAPLFTLCILAEYFLGQRRGKLPKNGHYTLSEVVCNFSLAAMHQASDLITGLFIAKLYLVIFDWTLLSIEITVLSFILLLILQDFAYYWFHRCSHRVRWMWAAHVVHHSSENMNFSTAFRQSLMYPLAGMWLFWVPLIVIGYPPNWVVFAVLLNLGLQFFVHTQWIRNLGWLERVFNTPSHHRVHHGQNPQYIDKNYAGILIVWDRLFGTFEPEVEVVRYGVTKSVNSFNPITVTFSEWKDLLNELFDSKLTLPQKIKYLIAPPSNRKN